MEAGPPLGRGRGGGRPGGEQDFNRARPPGRRRDKQGGPPRLVGLVDQGGRGLAAPVQEECQGVGGGGGGGVVEEGPGGGAGGRGGG